MRQLHNVSLRSVYSVPDQAFESAVRCKMPGSLLVLNGCFSPPLHPLPRARIIRPGPINVYCFSNVVKRNKWQLACLAVSTCSGHSERAARKGPNNKCRLLASRVAANLFVPESPALSTWIAALQARGHSTTHMYGVWVVCMYCTTYSVLHMPGLSTFVAARQRCSVNACRARQWRKIPGYWTANIHYSSSSHVPYSLCDIRFYLCSYGSLTS